MRRLSEITKTTILNVRQFSTNTTKRIFSSKYTPIVAAVTAIGSAISLGCFNMQAEDDHTKPPSYPWSHNGFFDSYDAASIRRGYQVYKEVCASCHSMDIISFRNLSEIAFTENEVKNLAADVEVWGEPDKTGKVTKRPGRPTDRFPAPYENEQEARFNNNGALPPDLSTIVKGRPYGEDYIFSLLTGYTEPPAGMKLREGLYFNPYFPGGAIGMAPPLSDGMIEYWDGTPATVSQMAKDVTTFLTFCSLPKREEQRKMGTKVILGLSLACIFIYYYKNFRWSIVKNAIIRYEK